MFLSAPLPVGMHLKVSPEGCHIFDQLSSPTAMKRSGCETCYLGLIAQHSFLAVVILTFMVLEVCAHDATSKRSILDETLEGSLCRTPQVHKVILSGIAFTRLPYRQSA